MSDDGGDDAILNDGSDPFNNEIDENGEVAEIEEPSTMGQRRGYDDEDEEEEEEDYDEEEEEDMDSE